MEAEQAQVEKGVANLDLKENHEEEEEFVQEKPIADRTLEDWFREYASIENTYRDKEISSVRERKLDSGQWVVMEKVHGANFVAITDGQRIVVGKRTSILPEDDPKSFFGHKGVVQKYTDSILGLFKSLKAQNPDMKVCKIYGEIFGGYYPNTEGKGGSRVQKEIHYCPHNDFYVFDIHDGSKYLDYDAAEKLFQEHKFLYAKPLFIGTFDEALAYSNSFLTTLPAVWGLPDVPGNFAEGVVIKPLQNKYFPTRARVIFKNKAEAFSEKQTKPVQKEKKAPTQEQLPKEVEEMLEHWESLITEARLPSVLSKMGPVTKKDTGAILKAYAKDVQDEFDKDFKDQYAKLDAKYKKRFTQEMGTQAAKIVNKYFNDQTSS